MNMIAIGMNLLLAGLLVAAMVVGVRLNRRLKALRDSHESFETAVRELNVAAARAEQGLADLRAATDEATDLLSDRIEKGRALAARLEKMTSAPPPAPAAAPVAAMPAARPRPAPPAPEAEVASAAPEERLGALLAAARAARARPETLVQPEPLVGRAPLPGRRVSPDEDLFEDTPLELDRRVGGRW